MVGGDMTPEEAAACQKLRDQYKRIHDNLDGLLNACGKDPVLKEEVHDNLQEALKNYIIAQNLILDRDAAKVKRLSEAADKSQEEIVQALEDLKNITNSVRIITEAVKTVGIHVANL